MKEDAEEEGRKEGKTRRKKGIGKGDMDEERKKRRHWPQHSH